MTGDTILVWMVALPFVGSVAAFLLPSDARNAELGLAGAVTLACTILAVLGYQSVADDGVVRCVIAWMPSLGLDFALRMDGLAWLFALLISGIGFLVVLYTRYYMAPADPIRRFYSFLLAFMGAMMGIVLSGNLIVLSFFWELTSIFSFLLIGFRHQVAGAREGARMALTITATGGFCLLVGLLLIGRIVGSYDLDKVLASGDLIRSSGLYVPVLVLILMGTLTKSAQFPFHFWLPNAMAAPTPVSAYLHSATMVKAGVFLMARLWPVLAGTQEWFWLVGLAGMISFVLGAYFAIFQQDTKGLLAYSTISHLGLITMLLSLGSPLGAVAAIFHMANHATFKASLFMAAGIIDHETGTRDMRRLGGLFRLMPITATLAMVASAAMAGVPLLNGFISKEMFFAETIETHVASILDTIAPYAAVLGSTFAVTYSIRFIHEVFFGPRPPDMPREPHEPPFLMRLPITLLVALCLLVGIIPAVTIGPFLGTAVRSVLGPSTPHYSLSPWHGLTLPLALSMTALVGGSILYLLLRGYLAGAEEGPPIFRHLKGQRIFERVLVTLSWRWARFLEAQLGTRRLQPQVTILVVLALLGAILPFRNGNFELVPLTFAGAEPAFAGLWAVGIACAVGAAWLAKFHRLAALILLGGSGVTTCVTFIWLSAPDLALTQLLVEIVTTVLILLGLRWLPKRFKGDASDIMTPSEKIRRVRDLGLAVFAGLGMTVVAYAVMTRTAPDGLSAFFLENAYPQGGGHNVVNVILVDFRGFDTMSEISVLAVVALTVFALLRRFRPAPDSVGAPEQQRIQNSFDEARPDRQMGDTVGEFLLVPSVLMRWLFPVVMVFSVYLFVRGHDLPGGGFVAGIAMATAFILQYMAGGTRWVESRLTVLPVNWMGAGLLLAAGTGAGSWLFGAPFLTSHSQHLQLPLIGEVPAATAMLFDLGVFALVMGATVLMLIALAHQSIRQHRPSRPVAEVDSEAA